MQFDQKRGMLSTMGQPNGYSQARLRRHAARCATIVAAIVQMPTAVDAAVIYSGLVNLPIPSNITGLYLNVVTGQYNQAGGGGNTVPNWTINIWNNAGLSFWVSTSPARTQHVQRVGGGAVANLQMSDQIGPTSIYGGWSSANLNGAITGAQPFVLNTANNLYGFRFQIDNEWHYGWARIALSDSLSGQPRVLVDYMWQDAANVPVWGFADPLGSCCLGDACQYMNLQGCLMSDGTWKNGSCWPNPCGRTPQCTGDIAPPPFGNGEVGVPDLLALISQWGACSPEHDCVADVNNDGAVGVPDLLQIISNWGTCS